MWDNPRLLNIAAGILVGVATLAFTGAGLLLLIRSPLSPIPEGGGTGELHQTTPRGIEAAGGARAGARLERFGKPYPATLGRIARRHEVVDLRYPNGFALRIPDMKS